MARPQLVSESVFVEAVKSTTSPTEAALKLGNVSVNYVVNRARLLRKSIKDLPVWPRKERVKSTKATTTESNATQAVAAPV